MSTPLGPKALNMIAQVWEVRKRHQSTPPIVLNYLVSWQLLLSIFFSSFGLEIGISSRLGSPRKAKLILTWT
jgi:hypothetical protein